MKHDVVERRVVTKHELMFTGADLLDMIAQARYREVRVPRDPDVMVPRDADIELDGRHAITIESQFVVRWTETTEGV